MKTILKMTLACVLSLSFMTLVSCGSKVNQKELKEKIEKASENEGIRNASFSDAEYGFMAKYLVEHISSMKEMQIDDPEAETIGNYMMILVVAQSQNKLKGDAKKDFESFQKKFNSLMDAELSKYGDSDSDEDSISEAWVVEEVVAEVDTDEVAVAVGSY